MLLTVKCRSQKSTHMPTSETMCCRALKNLVIMQFRSWLFKSIHIMLVLGNSFEVSHVLSLLFVCCTAYTFNKILQMGRQGSIHLECGVFSELIALNYWKIF